MTAKPTTVHRAFRPELTDTNLPPGVIGQVGGIALVYDVVDSYGTLFARGALERTMRERVAAGKVKLFWDHGDSPTTGMYDSDLHIGTVRSLKDVQLPDGRWAAYMVADLLDTPKAHEVKQYLESVLASGGETGLSVGGITKGMKTEMTRVNGDAVERITEFPLREISITSMQAVPDSEVLAVRAEESPSTESPSTEVPTVPVEAPSRVALTGDRVGMEAAFDALLLALPADTVRARLGAAGLEASGLRAVMGDAEDPEDSDAGGPTPLDSDAAAEDSRTTEETTPPIVYATMDERLRALRSSYAEAA